MEKEILVQDLSLGYTLQQFHDYNLYRRDKVTKMPKYIAPYFAEGAAFGGGVGIHFKGKVLGHLRFKAADLDVNLNTIQAFAGGNTALADRWVQGIKIEEEPHKEFHYFFLDEPERLLKPITKRASRDSSKPIRNQLGLGGQIATMQQFIEWINHSYGA